MSLIWLQLYSHVPCTCAQGKYRVAIWHGTKVAVKELYTGDLADEGL
jgi:hypothetical protein